MGMNQAALVLKSPRKTTPRQTISSRNPKRKRRENSLFNIAIFYHQKLEISTEKKRNEGCSYNPCFE
jgi:hypothetical protein